MDLFEDGLKLLEIEETNKTRERKLPDFIQVSDEVTDNVDYRNAAIYDRLNKTKNQTKKKCLLLFNWLKNFSFNGIITIIVEYKN